MTELALRNSDYTREQIELIKKTVAQGATDTELQLFLYQAQRTGLDPLTKQIHFIKRKKWNKDKKAYDEIATIQTGIDGFRAIADRTEFYAPGPAPVITYKPDGKPESATAEVIKMVQGKEFKVGATAYYDEFVQADKEGKPMGLWAKMPRLMLAKCAEALALRKAFPHSLSGIYAHEEMAQADPVVEVEVVHTATPTPEAPSGGPPATSPPKGKTSNYDFLKVMGEQKKRVGERSYYVVLGKHGYTHSNEITERETQVKVFNDLKEIAAE